jgi:hypothetical protein
MILSVINQRNQFNNLLNLAIKHYWFLMVLILSALIKFSTTTPVVWMQDSVKYHIPLPVIAEQNWSWILETLNPSLITRIIYFLIESSDNGSPEKIIIMQKFLNLLSTILFYLISLKLSKNKIKISALASFIFTINPLALFMEQTLMAETIFVFFSLVCLMLFILVIESNSTLLTIIFAISLGLFSMVKDSSGLYLNIIYSFLFIVCLLKKRTFSFKNFFLLIIISQLILLPIKIYNLKHFGIFNNSRFQGTGAVLWFLTEEMLLNNPPKSNYWLTNYLVSTTNKFKSSYKIKSAKSDRQAFFAAVISINNLGRIGALTNPETHQLMSSQEWNSLAVKYWLETIKLNPWLSLQNLLSNTKEYLFSSNLFFKSDILYSNKQDLNREFSFFTIVPFSFKDQFDPQLRSCPIVKPLYLMDNGDLYKDANFINKFKNSYSLMLNTNTNYAFIIPDKGLSVFIQKTLYHVPLSKLLLPLFLVSLFFYYKKSFFRTQNPEFILALFLLISSIFFLVLPLPIHGEPRYQIQFTHYMMLFMVLVFSRSH